MPGALEGLRVVDLTTGLAGPIATMTLERPRRRRGEGRAAAAAIRSGRTWARSSPTAGSAASCSTSTTPADRERLLALRRHRRRARRELRARVPRGARARLRHASRADRPALDLLLAHRLPAHHRRRRPSRHRPAGAGALGHAVRAARLPRRPDLPARAAAEHRRVVPHGGGRPRRAVRRASSPGAGSGWRRRSTRVCSRSPRSCGRTPSTGCEPWFEIGFEPRPSIYECADGLWVHSMHFAGGRGKDRSIVWKILGHRPARPRVEPDRAVRRSRTSSATRSGA